MTACFPGVTMPRTLLAIRSRNTRSFTHAAQSDFAAYRCGIVTTEGRLRLHVSSPVKSQPSCAEGTLGCQPLQLRTSNRFSLRQILTTIHPWRSQIRLFEGDLGALSTRP